MAGIVTFDTHAFIKKMISTGMSEEQAETLATGLAEIVTDRLATKDDLALYHRQTETEFAKVRGEIKDLGAELRIEMKDQGAELRSEITEVRSEIKELDKKIDVQGAELKVIRTEMQVLGKDIIIKLGGTIVVCAGLIFALLRYLPAVS